MIKPFYFTNFREYRCSDFFSDTWNRLDYLIFFDIFSESKDIWWIESDGSNVEEVIADIKQSFLNDGLKWFKEYQDINTAFTEIENGHDSYNKFFKASYFAEHLNEKDKLLRYTQLMEQERKRIGF